MDNAGVVSDCANLVISDPINLRFAYYLEEGCTAAAVRVFDNDKIHSRFYDFAILSS